MSLKRPAYFIMALAAAIPAGAAVAQQPRSGGMFSDPNGLGHMMDSMLPLVRKLERCVTSPGVADPDCVGRAMQEEVKRRYGDAKPGQQTPDQGARNFDRFFGGNLGAPYVDPDQSSRNDDDSFLYQRRFYGMPGLIGPRPNTTPDGAPFE